MRVLLAVLGLLLLLGSSPAQAGRGFFTTYGTNGSDVVNSNVAITEGSQISYSVWFVQHGVGSSGFGVLLDAIQTGTTGISGLGVPNIANTLYFVHKFSTTNGQWNFTVNNSTSWQHLCVTYDSSATSNNPTVYLNGSLISTSTIATPVGTAVSNVTSFTAGGQNGAASAWDGKVADVAYWSGQLLTANECLALYKGASPLSIRPTSLALYLPLWGNGTNEVDYGIHHSTVTVTGAKAVNNGPASPFNPQGR